MFRLRLSRLLIVAALAFAVSAHADDWRFNLGAGIRNQTPVVAVGAIGYKEVILRVQGMGYIHTKREFWSCIRGSLLWTFFKDYPFNIDAGVGGGYEYARAPNRMHQTLNRLNEDWYILPYNYKEVGDVSLELWTHLYGIYTQISVPVKWIAEHDAPKLLWGAGYMFEF